MSNKKIKVFAVALLIVSACSNEADNKESKADAKTNTTNSSPLPSASFSPATNISANSVKENNFKPNFIKAANLLKKIQGNEQVFVLDVRNIESYQESHIKGALSAALPITEATVKQIPKFAEVVTYCGCPHHLSSIGAEQLTNMGYTNVSVLDEGFWFWKDNKYPLEVSKAAAAKISEIKISGKLLKNGVAYPNVDLYMKHEKSGQLEAVKTSPDGSYQMHFHLYNYTKRDEFKFYVGNLSNPVQSFTTDKDLTENVDVIVK